MVSLLCGMFNPKQLTKGSIPSNGPFARLSSSQFADPTSAPENRENARETNFRILPGLHIHGSIRESLYRHSFPMPRKTPALRPNAGSSFLVFLSVRVKQRELLDSGKHATPETQVFASTDPMPSIFWLRIHGYRPAERTSRMITR
jgi:hypothetical protein